MAIDFITEQPQANPTEGIEEQAPAAPYVPSTLLDTAKTDLWQDTGRAIRGISNFVAKYGYDDPETGQTMIQAEQPISPDQLKTEFPGVTGIKEALPRTIVENMQAQQQADAKRAEINARYPTGALPTLARLGSGVITGLLDPVDDAAFMVPVVGESRYAGWLARAGESSGSLGRAGVTAGVGAIRGATGGAILATGKAALGDPDMSLGEIASETLQSAVGGSILHGITGFRSDILGHRFAETPEGATAAGNAAVHDDATRVAAAQIADDQPVEVRPVFDAARQPMSRADLLGTTAMERTQPVYVDEAVARAAGRPTQQDMLADDMAQQARSTTPEQVDQGSMAEAERMVAQLRELGLLTPEEEAELRAYEPKPVSEEGRTKGSEEKATAEAQGGAGGQDAPEAAQPHQRIVAAAPDSGFAGGLPDVVGDRTEPSQSGTEPAAFNDLREGESTRAAPQESDIGRAEIEAPISEEQPPSEGRQHVEDMRDRAFSRALDRVLAGERGAEVDPLRRRSTIAALRKLVADLHDGKIDDDAFQRHTEGLLEHLEERRAGNLLADVGDRERGADYIRQRLLEAKRRGDISEQAADLGEWFIQQNPRLADELGISIRAPREGGSAGQYTPLNRVMTLFKGAANDETAIHEMLHHLERMMPDDIRQAIRAEWSRAVAAAIRSGDDRMRDYLAAVLKANESRSPTDLEAARQLLPSAAAYQYLNPSEFWAVNASRVMASRFDAQSGIGARLRQWLGELIERAKGLFGLRSDAPMISALSRLINEGTGEAAGPMLSDFRQFGDLNAEEMDAATRAKQKLTAMQDMVKRHTMAAKIDELHAQGLSLAHGFDALTRGISEAVHGARDSTAQRQLAHQEFLIGRMVANLEKIPGAMEAWRGRTMTAGWVRELAELNKADGQPGISKSPLALEIAKAVHDAQDIARLNLNRAGAWVGDYDGYVSRTQHDAMKIHSAGYENWKSAVLGGIDQDKTFEGLSAPERETFLHNMWDALSTGVHMSSDHGVDPKAAAFAGGANVARRASAGRVLHWKDADSWRQYQEQFGDPVIERGVLESLRRAGRDTALMERWGSNPQGAFDTLVRQTREKYRSDHDALATLDKQLPRIREEFAHLTGEASRPQSNLASKIRGSILALQDITKLGNVLLAHLSTTLTKPFQLQYLGVGRWKAYTSVLSNLMKDTTPEGRAVLENLRANATGQFQDMMGGYEPVDGIPGQLARVRQFSMRIGGLPWMLARQKAGTMWEVANFLGQHLDKHFADLDPRTSRGLSIYGITPTEWDVLRTAPDHDRDGSGSVFLTPKAAMRADVSEMAEDRLSKALDDNDADRIREETRNNLAMKLAAYYADAADRSTVTPGVQERAFFTRHAGRTWGPALGQYKGWAMAAVRTMWGQSIHGSSSRAESVKYLAELMAVGTAVGYARLAITDAINGQVPQQFNGEPVKDTELLGKAMVAGGAMGIFGDYLMGQYSRAGESSSDRAKDLALNVMGPAFADIANAYGLAREFGSIPFADDAGHALDRADADGMKFLTSHLPVVNTFYLRTLSHWLFLDRLNEAADPGYLQRHQDAVKERTGQDFWLPPTQYAGA